MRYFLIILMLLSQTACTGMLLGGAKSGQYPQPSGQPQCDENDQDEDCS